MLAVGKLPEEGGAPRRWWCAMPAGRIVTHDCWPLLGGLRLPIKSRTLHLGAQTYEPAWGGGEEGRGGGVDTRCCAATVNTLGNMSAVEPPWGNFAYLYIIYICIEDDAGSRSILEFGAKFDEMDGMRSFPSDGNIYGNIILNKIDSFSQDFTI